MKFILAQDIWEKVCKVTITNVSLPADKAVLVYVEIHFTNEDGDPDFTWGWPYLESTQSHAYTSNPNKQCVKTIVIKDLWRYKGEYYWCERPPEMPDEAVDCIDEVNFGLTPYDKDQCKVLLGE